MLLEGSYVYSVKKSKFLLILRIILLTGSFARDTIYLDKKQGKLVERLGH